MVGLLRANFARLWKTRSLWWGIILPSAYNIFCSLLFDSYYEAYHYMRDTNSMLLLFSAVFAVLYIGTDHSDKTIRNKLIVGISRVKIYFANLLTVTAGMSVIFVGNWLLMTAFVLARGGNIEPSAGQLAMYILICLCAGAAMSAVCTLIAMLVPSKALAAVLAIVLFIGLFYSRQLITRLTTAPLHVIQIEEGINGEQIVAGEYYENNYVVSKGVYNASQIVYNFIPESQIKWADSFMGDLQSVFGELALYSLGLTSAATVVGVLAFRRKDLK